MAADFTVRIVGLEVMTEERLQALEALVRLCRQDGVEGEIVYRPPTGSTPPPWWEITLINIASSKLETGTDHQVRRLVETLSSRASEWARSRVERGETTRPQSVTIFGPDGFPVRKIEAAEQAVLDDPGSPGGVSER